MQVAPAGAVWSSIEDMAKYAAMLVSEGVAPNGTRVISATALQTTQTVQAAFSPFVGYGLGWFIRSFGEEKVVSHAGGTAGFGALVSTVPENGNALVVLTNSNETSLFRSAVERYVGELRGSLPHAGHADLLADFNAGMQTSEQLLGRTRLATAEELGELSGHYGEAVSVWPEDGVLGVRTPYGKLRFRPLSDDEDLFIAIDVVGNGTLLVPERNSESGVVEKLRLSAPETASPLQIDLVLERKSLLAKGKLRRWRFHRAGEKVCNGNGAK